MLRTIILALFLIIFFIISIPLFIIEEILGRFNIRAKERSSFVIVMTALRIVGFISGINLTVIGKENIPSEGAVLYTPNHRSYFDIITLYPLTKNTTAFVAKKEMEKIPFISVWMRYMNCEFLDRNDIRAGLKSILKCADLVKNGESVCIFPEGTRSSGDELNEFKDGSFKIADKTGCAIIPVAISNTDNIFENHIPYIKKQKIIVEFGQPIYMKELAREDKKRIGSIVQENIAEMLEKNKLLIK